MKESEDKKDLKSFIKKHVKLLQKAELMAYAMVLDRELQKALGDRYKNKIVLIKERFDSIKNNFMPEFPDYVKEFGRDVAFDTYELILAHRNDRNWRGQQYTVNLPASEKLLQAYAFEKHTLSKLRLIKNPALRAIELRKIYPEFKPKQIHNLAYSDLAPSQMTLVVLSIKYSASALYIRNKLTEARKKKIVN